MKKLLSCVVILCLSAMFVLPDLTFARPPIPPPPPPPVPGPPPPPLVPPPPPPLVPPPIVVPPPPGVVIVPPAVVVGGRISITASVLNVRSGPGMNYPVIGYVYMGSVLALHGNAPGWLYVLLPDGGFGWVSALFTVPVP